MNLNQAVTALKRASQKLHSEENGWATIDILPGRDLTKVTLRTGPTDHELVRSYGTVHTIETRHTNPVHAVMQALTNSHTVWSDTTPAGYLDTLGITNTEIVANFGPVDGNCEGNMCNNTTDIEIWWTELEDWYRETLENPGGYQNEYEKHIGACIECANILVDEVLDQSPRLQGIQITIQEPA